MKLAALTVACALALPATAHADAPGLAPMASSAAGRAITVECSVPAGAPEAGYTYVGGNKIWLNAPACRALSHLARHDHWLGGRTDSVDNTSLAGAAIQVLVHEATHLRLASGDEAQVECAASRNYWPIIAAFGLPARLAKSVLNAALHIHHNLKSATYKEMC